MGENDRLKLLTSAYKVLFVEGGTACMFTRYWSSTSTR